MQTMENQCDKFLKVNKSIKHHTLEIKSKKVRPQINVVKLQQRKQNLKKILHKLELIEAIE